MVAYSLTSGWVPPRSSSGVYLRAVLPLYFATLLSILTLSFIISRNTMMHHYRSGTVQPATDPIWLWWIVSVQALIALVLAIVGCVNWIVLHGRVS